MSKWALVGIASGVSGFLMGCMFGGVFVVYIFFGVRGLMLTVTRETPSDQRYTLKG